MLFPHSGQGRKAYLIRDLKEIKEYAIVFRRAINKNIIWEELPAEPGIERINDVIFQFETTTMIPYVLYIEKNVHDIVEIIRSVGALEES